MLATYRTLKQQEPQEREGERCVKSEPRLHSDTQQAPWQRSQSNALPHWQETYTGIANLRMSGSFLPTISMVISYSSLQASMSSATGLVVVRSSARQYCTCQMMMYTINLPLWVLIGMAVPRQDEHSSIHATQAQSGVHYSNSHTCLSCKTKLQQCFIIARSSCNPEHVSDLHCQHWHWLVLCRRGRNIWSLAPQWWGLLLPEWLARLLSLVIVMLAAKQDSRSAWQNMHSTAIRRSVAKLSAQQYKMFG